MTRPTKEQREQGVLERSRTEFARVQEAMQGERRQCLEDRRFVSIPGAMWEGGFGEMFANKPRLEINKAMLSLIRIYNEYRNNRITVDFVSRDGAETDLADTCDDLYRADGESVPYDTVQERGIGAFSAPSLAPNYISDTRQTGLYVQNQAKYDERFVIVAGLRRDRYREVAEAEWVDGPVRLISVVGDEDVDALRVVEPALDLALRVRRERVRQHVPTSGSVRRHDHAAHPEHVPDRRGRAARGFAVVHADRRRRIR